MWTHPSFHSEPPARLTSADLPLQLRLAGHKATLRCLGPEDTGRLVELFASNCEETIQRHAFAPGMRMNLEAAERLVGVDQQQDVAIGIFEEIDGEQRLMGLGWYYLEAESQRANASFVVHSQGRVIGFENFLLQALIGIARERKLNALVARVRPDDAAMITALRVAGATFRSLRGSHLLEAAVQVHDSEYETAACSMPDASIESWVRDLAARTALKLETASEVLGKLPTP